MLKWLPYMIAGGLLLGGSAFWYHSRSYSPSQLIEMLPPERASHVYVNVGLLRQAGILDAIAGSPTLEDPDYKKFVEETGFDYRDDLTGLAIAFRDGDVYYAAQGNFDWEKLAAYAPAHGGSCGQFQCRAPGSEPGRDVSYYMPRNGVLALAVSRNATAGDMISPGTWANAPDPGDAALWASLPPFTFSDLSKAPAGTRSFLSPLADAESSILTLGPGSSGSNSFELKIAVTARDAKGATDLAKQYTDATDLLKKMLERDKMTANPDDISGILTSGKFSVSDKQVTAVWPISRAFLDGLASSIDVGNK